MDKTGNSFAWTRFQTLLAISPAASILEAWMPIESRLKELSRRYPIKKGSHVGYPSTRGTIERLYLDKAITDSAFDILKDLLQLRNVAAHASDRDTTEISASDAVRFQKLAITAQRELAPL